MAKAKVVGKTNTVHKKRKGVHSKNASKGQNRDFILFHRGNSAKDTRGCILVGQGSQQDIVHNSTLAMDLLMKEIINLGGTNINLIIKNK